MFSNLLPSSNVLFSVSYKNYALKHFRKAFEKDYSGKRWERTESSFFEDLRRLRMPNNTTQQSTQIDELKHKDDFWLFKYDFKIAGTNESPKTSGHRIIGFIDIKSNKIGILIIYTKTYLPKNKNETAYINSTLKEEYSDINELFK